MTFKRNSNTIKLAQFWEYWQLNKFNVNPKFQRKSFVWSEDKRAYLIDTIFRDYPMPPIFLREHIDKNTGETKYDVIDGKQRIESIVSFLKDDLAMPNDIYDDYASLSSKKLSEIMKDPTLEPLLLVFWRYNLPIEYIATEKETVINDVFDRLNRNGEPLTRQELRHSKHSGTELYKLIKRLKEIPFWKKNLHKLKDNRMEDDEFVSELLFFIISGKIEDSNPKIIDNHYDKYSKYNKDKLLLFEDQFSQLTERMTSILPDLSQFRIDGTSHLYGLWCFIYKTGMSRCFEHIRIKIHKFYTELRNKNYDIDMIKKYKESMSAGTKSRIQRVRRANALLEYCGIDDRYNEA
ncbi:MAG TPA: DUF262 domain-containing protein [Candidatus Syntrophosphaera sp.]|nr:DUF262 domain-containing protein [Candidatus Cloacimonadota bacterium]HOR02493.1 DUF262 domain-containing protein [Candidatus Syntrophosphaera sp.]HPK83257.1 DUF262 domain-containing protein [Candidatus Syntrophosphaera sp.]HQG94763.1 DUF262 domain-containing protein [Candidatus Syntrophosphaera sp.]HQK29614.1 DUF262 domain-containing protein [Candidatus Syntrophosphaera sp.]